MATRTLVTLVDDLDGSTADQSVSFGLDRVEYEIDLTSEHAESLRAALAPYTAAARRTGGRRAARQATATRTGSADGAASAGRSRSTNAQIRTWAGEHGVTLAERGRIPGRVIEAFEAGDPSLLPTESAGEPATVPEPAAPSTNTEPDPAPSGNENGTRGRDGLTASERETVRAWAMDQGIEVKPRGQLKKDLVSNYRAWEARQS